MFTQNKLGQIVIVRPDDWKVKTRRFITNFKTQPSESCKRGWREILFLKITSIKLEIESFKCVPVALGLDSLLEIQN